MKGVLRKVGAYAQNLIGIYVRISRDENGENSETIENQRGLLFEYARSRRLGEVVSVYTDDNVSGSAFERAGLTRLKEDVLSGRINIVLLKDLSRLGRNNAKTLQWIDFLEEYGVRILTADGRYDSLIDNETLGIETWANERYIRDISRKIRASLHFKINRGEYVGKAPFGYKKSENERNRLVIDEAEAETVRLIYRLYRAGMGYTAVARYLDAMKSPSPEGIGWNRISVRRILCSDVYIGNTVQGVSEKISFKSRKTRRLPKSEWVRTEGTHQGIVSLEEFTEVQRLRQQKNEGRELHRGGTHTLKGVIRCGGCGSSMYARTRAGGAAYVCGNYARNGSAACSSHFVYENEITRFICDELLRIFDAGRSRKELSERFGEWLDSADSQREGNDALQKKLEACRRKQELLYKDRLEGLISAELFGRMNKKLEERLGMLSEKQKLSACADRGMETYTGLLAEAEQNLRDGILSNEIVRVAVKSITVFDRGEYAPGLDEGAVHEAETETVADPGAAGERSNADAAAFAEGAIVIDFRF